MDRRMISIMGDSISTYEGYHPAGYAVYYDTAMQTRNGLESVYDTWWAKVNQALHTGEYQPDLILVYMGINDFGYGVELRQSGIRHLMKKDPLLFQDAYELMVKQIRQNYPKAELVCGTLLQSFVRANTEWEFPERYMGHLFSDYNEVIRQTCRKAGCLLADLEQIGVLYETFDGTHPTVNGHKTISEAWILCLGELGVLN